MTPNEMYEAGAYAALASGALAVLVGTQKAWMPQLRYAALWLAWQAFRPAFRADLGWRYLPGRQVRRHRHTWTAEARVWARRWRAANADRFAQARGRASVGGFRWVTA